jgi:transcriptional regulator with XRE-family HTH domain
MAKAPCELMKAARKKAGKTQSDIATELGFTQAQISKWEAGDGFPATLDVRRVARVYGLRPEQLLPADEANAS